MKFLAIVMPENRIFGQFCPNLPKNKKEDLNGPHNFFLYLLSREIKERYMLEGYYYTFKKLKIF